MLRSYLSKARSTPSFAIEWPDWGGWAIFGLFALLEMWHLLSHGFVIGIIAGSVSGSIVKKLRRPRTDAEKMEVEILDAVSTLQTFAVGSMLKSHVPWQVLNALEAAAVAHHAASIRFASEGPATAVIHMKALDECMAMCVYASSRTFKDDTQPGKVYKALQSNQQVIDAVIETIQSQVARMEQNLGANYERLAALKELEDSLIASSQENLA